MSLLNKPNVGKNDGVTNVNNNVATIENEANTPRSIMKTIRASDGRP